MRLSKEKTKAIPFFSSEWEEWIACLSLAERAAKERLDCWWWLIAWICGLWAAPAALLRKEKQTSTTPPTIEIHECNEWMEMKTIHNQRRCSCGCLSFHFFLKKWKKRQSEERATSGKPSGSAASTNKFNSTFLSPAEARRKVNEFDWLLCALPLPCFFNKSIKHFDLIWLIPRGKDKQSFSSLFNWFIYENQREREWFVFL